MKLPRQVLLSTAFPDGLALHGQLPGAVLQRLAEAVEHEPAPVDVTLDLEQLPDTSRWLKGTLNTGLNLTCHRCEAQYLQPLVVALKLQLVRSEEEEQRLGRDCDPLLVEGDTLDLAQLVEDELLLALPMLPRCPACENTRPAAQPVEPTAKPGNPFAALKGRVERH